MCLAEHKVGKSAANPSKPFLDIEVLAVRLLAEHKGDNAAGGAHNPQPQQHVDP